MSAVRKLEYIYESEMTPLSPQAAVSTEAEVKVVAQPFYVMLATSVLIMALVAATCYLALAVLQRHAEIDRLQLEIFNRQQAINKTEVMVDELYVIRESFMTIEEIESYATENLNMIKPSDQQKVVLAGGTYYELDEHVAFKKITQAPTSDDWWSAGIKMLSAILDFTK